MPKDLKKLSPKTILEGKKVKDLDEGLVCTFSGSVIGVISGEDTKNGIWTGFKGAFLGVRASDKKEFRSLTCFVPALGIDVLLNGLNSRSDKNKDKAVDFCFDIIKVNDETTAVGYFYEVDVILAPELEVDPLDAVAKKVAEARKKGGEKDTKK